MVFLADNVGDGICMPMESGMTGDLGTFSQAAGVVRGDKAKTRYGTWDQVYCLGLPFTMMPLHYKKGNNEWLGCLSMEFKGPYGGVAVAGWRVKEHAQVVARPMHADGSDGTEEEHCAADKDMMQHYFVDAGVKLDTVFPTVDAQDDVFLPLLLRGLRVMEAADYSTIHVYPCCSSWFCMGLERFGLMNQACARGCGQGVQATFAVRFQMLVQDEVGHELDALFEGHYCTERVLGCIRKDHGAPTDMPTEEAVFDATQVWKGKRIWIVGWVRPHADKDTPIHVIRFGLSD